MNPLAILSWEENFALLRLKLEEESHLESHGPIPPQWGQMCCKERVKQANEALMLLKIYPNVDFGGDMNWDDKLYGEFPLQDGWTDAWSLQRPREIGWIPIQT